MPGYPASSDALGAVIQDTDGSVVDSAAHIPATPGPYIYRLGSSLSPAQPSTWQNIPKGAFPINPPAALTTGSPLGYTGTAGQLTAAQYQWVITNVTDYGETIANTSPLVITAATLGSNTSVRLVLPAPVQGTTVNPIRAWRIYRTAAGGSTFGLVTEIADLALTYYVDGKADIFLGGPPPGTNTSGAIGVVAVSGGGYAGAWTEVASGTTPGAQQYSVDYSYTLTGGNVTFSSTDQNKTVTVTYTVSTELSSALVGSIVTAQKDTRTILGSTPQGAYADASTRMSSHETTLATHTTSINSNANDLAAAYGTFPNVNAGRGIRQVGSIALTSGGTRLAMYLGTYLIVPSGAAQNTPLIDVSDPTTPVNISNLNAATNAVTLLGHTVWQAGGTFFSTASLDNPNVPSGGSFFSTTNPMTDILSTGRYILATCRTAISGGGYSGATIILFDPINNANPWHITLADSAFLALSYDGNYALVTVGTTGKVCVIRLLDGAVVYQTPNATFNNPAGIAVVGRYAYVANKGAGTLGVVDVKSNAALTLVTTLNLNTGAPHVNAAPNQVIAAGDYLYVSGSGVVSVVSIKQPATPVLVTTFNVGGASTATTGMYAWDRYLAVADTTNSLLRIFDLSSIDIAAATIGTLGAGRLTVHEGAHVYGGIATDRFDVGEGGGFFDGDVAFAAGIGAAKAVGLAHIADGSADGSFTNVSNTLVTTNSIILLTMASTPGTCYSVAELKSNRVAGSSFTIQNKGAVGSTGGYGLDVGYIIIN